jgi:hypothetical protein
MWQDLWNHRVKEKVPVSPSGQETVVEQPRTLRVGDMMLQPALGGIVIKCPECYWNWYSPVGGIRICKAVNAIEEHIARKHS